MKIVEYKYSDGPNGGWNYSKIALGNINLFVGESGSGKTKLLNTIFNIGSFIISSQPGTRGVWEFEFDIEGVRYSWHYMNSNGNKIEKEIITQGIGNDKKIIVDRTADKFLFHTTPLPKLSSQVSAICLLKEEPEIEKLFNGFGKIMRRNFFSNELEKAAEYGNIPAEILSKITNTKDIKLLAQIMPLSSRLYILNRVFPDKYNQICNYFKSIFKTIQTCELPNFSTVYPEISDGLPHTIPVFAVREKGVKNLIGLNELWSGMQKVLLLLTDIMTLSGEDIYLLDEYENSLGINAINFFPDFLIQHGGNNQFIITTHHPYLINNMPIKDWYVFHRSGSDVAIMHGKELESRYGTSKQKAFVQLINDPFYSQGVQ